MAIEFADFTDQEAAEVAKIIKRAAKMEREAGGRLNRQSLEMDLAAAHATMGLDLHRLAAFPDFDFAHDVYGIMRHMDRSTGRIRDHFIPRCASKKEEHK
jgi:hypothetical protein